LCFLHFFFFFEVVPGVTKGWPAGPAGAGPQATSVIAAELGLGFGVASLKSAALLFVSSESSRRVGQPGAIDRMMALPFPTEPRIPVPWNGEPTEDGRLTLPVKSPQETQSIGVELTGQHTAPPAGLRSRVPSVRSGVTPGNAPPKPLSAINAVALFALFDTGSPVGTTDGKVEAVVPLAL
jgi:hypothetical protein